MKYLDVPSSGSIADRCHSHNRAGQYTRNRRAPVQPVGTGRRSVIRSALSAASKAWAGLSTYNQAAWVSYADSHPYTDSLGQSFKLTGSQMYCSIGVQLLNVGDALGTAVPASDVVNAVTSLSLSAAAGVAAVSVTWDAGAGTDYVLISFSPQVSPGRASNNRWWQAAALADDATPYNALVAFQTEFGTLSEGRKIFCKATPVNVYGVTGTPTITSTLVAS